MTTESRPAGNEASALPQPVEQVQRVPIRLGARGLELQTFNDMWRFATCLAASGLAPPRLNRPESLLVAMEMGAELGLPAMAAVQNIAVINGQPRVFGDAGLALCMSSPHWDASHFEEELVYAQGSPIEAICRVARRGHKPIERRFTLDDAKRAGLLAKQGPWTQYTARMLQMRARSWALRDAFPDVLLGFSLIDPSEAEAAQTVSSVNQIAEPPPESQATTSKVEALAARLMRRQQDEAAIMPQVVDQAAEAVASDQPHEEPAIAPPNEPQQEPTAAPVVDQATNESAGPQDEAETEWPPISIEWRSVRFPAGTDTPEMRAAITRWVQYRQKIGKPYWQPTGQVNLLLNRWGQDLPRAVEQSIARGRLLLSLE